MNEWGLIGQEIFVRIEKSAKTNIFKKRPGYEQLKRLLLFNFHSL
jgi:hypothetical protein